MRKKQTYIEEHNVPKGVSFNRNIGFYSESKKLPANISTQFLEPKKDIERMVENGLQNLSKLKCMIKNTGSIYFLDYVEKRIRTCRILRDDQKEELLAMIAEHQLRQED